jgi:hypothetical protein
MTLNTVTDSKAFARATVRGLWIAIPTPFTPDGSEVDTEVLAGSVEHYIDVLQVDGIFCGGVMGFLRSSCGSGMRRLRRGRRSRCSCSTRPSPGPR